jgi:hypothetical protein
VDKYRKAKRSGGQAKARQLSTFRFEMKSAAEQRKRPSGVSEVVCWDRKLTAASGIARGGTAAAEANSPRFRRRKTGGRVDRSAIA